jgi:hypothetical protein
MEEDAAKAISEKHLWENHLERCNGLEQKDREWKRAIARNHAEQLRLQMQHDEQRRVQEREDFRTKINMHDFPCFREPADLDVRGYLHERRSNLRQDLDQQVESRIRMEQLQKQRELDLDRNNIEASQYEVQKIRGEENSKRKQERAILAHSWDQDMRLKTVKKAIQDHHKTPGPKAVLSSLVSNLSGSAKGSASVTSPTVLSPPAVPSPPRLSTPGGMSDRSSASSRMPGSARRMPIGAAASLSLHKEKLITSARR